MKRQELIKNFITKIERERIRLGFTQAQMAEKLEMSLSGYKKMVSGETTKIDIYIAYLLYELTGRKPFDLLGETGPDMDLYNQIGELSAPQQRFVTDVVEFELQFLARHQNTDDYISVLVPTGNLEDGMIVDSFNLEKVNIHDYRQRFGNRIHCGIRITSNHLHPVYHINDILLICRQPPRDGDTGIFINRDNGCAYIRKFHQTNPCLLEPVNGQGLSYYVDSYDEEDMNRWIKFGYVLTKMRI